MLLSLRRGLRGETLAFDLELALASGDGCALLLAVRFGVQVARAPGGVRALLVQCAFVLQIGSAEQRAGGLFHLADRASQPVVDECSVNGLRSVVGRQVVVEEAARLGIRPAQQALALALAPNEAMRRLSIL